MEYQVTLDVILGLKNIHQITQASRKIEKLRIQIEKLKILGDIAFHINIAGGELLHSSLRETVGPFSEIEAKTAKLATVLSDLNGAIKNPAVEVTKKATSLAARRYRKRRIWLHQRV